MYAKLVEDEIPEIFKSVEEAVDKAFGEIQATMRCKHSHWLFKRKPSV